MTSKESIKYLDDSLIGYKFYYDEYKLDNIDVIDLYIHVTSTKIELSYKYYDNTILKKKTSFYDFLTKNLINTIIE
jgi:hypothetical protein